MRRLGRTHGHPAPRGRERRLRWPANRSAEVDHRSGAGDLAGPRPEGARQGEERRQKIRAIANEVFDWEETGKRALARHWQGRSPQERGVSEALRRPPGALYVGKIEAYTGEKIIYGEEAVDGSRPPFDEALYHGREPRSRSTTRC